MSAVKILHMFGGKPVADAAVLVPEAEVVWRIVHDRFDQAATDGGPSRHEIFRGLPVISTGVGQNQDKHIARCKPHDLFNAETTPTQGLHDGQRREEKRVESAGTASGDGERWRSRLERDPRRGIVMEIFPGGRVAWASLGSRERRWSQLPRRGGVAGVPTQLGQSSEQARG